MRLKEYIIFLVLFTICYFGFFMILDKIADLKMKKRVRKRIQSVMDEKKFFTFACFYGVQKTFSKELLLSIYQDVQNINVLKLSDYSQKYQMSVLEFITVILYFEFFHIMDKRKFILNDDYAQIADYNDQSIFYKYGSSFLEKKSYSEILSVMGNQAKEELKYLDQYFLIPGIRVIGEIIYYVGGLDEKA